MTVAWILKDKGRNVVSALPSVTLNEIVTLLASNRIGAVVIADELHRVLGIISERDIVRILATQGPAALDEPAGEHMTRSVVTCSEQNSIDWLMEEMTSRRFRHLPVTDQGRLAGIVSIGDVVKFKLALAESEAAQMRQYFVAG
ncbi:MAG: CBS domain-containing protein [Rhodomicrobium sp.]